MAKEALMQLRMDSIVKQRAEETYRATGTSFAEAIRIFAVQSIEVGGFPFQPMMRGSSKVGMKGRLAQYAQADLAEREKRAFARASAKKHQSREIN